MAETYNPGGQASPATVGAGAVVELLPARGERVALVLKADSGNAGSIYLTLDGSDPSATHWHVELTAKEGLSLDKALTSAAIKAIASTAGQKIGFCEA